MKAALLKNTKIIQVEDVDYRKPDPDYLIIDTQSTGICGSDLHGYHGAWGFSEQAGGHEVSGIIKEVGEGVTQLQPGDRVVVEAFKTADDKSTGSIKVNIYQ